MELPENNELFLASYFFTAVKETVLDLEFTHVLVVIERVNTDVSCIMNKIAIIALENVYIYILYDIHE